MRTAKDLDALKQGESQTIQYIRRFRGALSSYQQREFFPMFKDGIVLKNALDSTQIQTAISLVNGLLKETTQSRYKTHTATVSTRTQLLLC